MSTNLPLQSSNQLSGQVDELKKTIVKRGYVDVVMSAWSAGGQAVATVYLDDVTNNQQVGLLKVEAGVDVALAGTVIFDIPGCDVDTDGTIYQCGSVSNSYLEGAGFTRQILQMIYYNSTMSASDTVRFYYRVYSEATLTQDWAYKSS